MQSASNRSAILEAPLVASEDWYSSVDIVDGKATESTQEWRELLAQFVAERDNAGPPLERTRVKKALASTGVPADLRAEVWMTFSGAHARMLANKGLYADLCGKVQAFHAANASRSGGSSGGSGDGSGSGGGGGGGSNSIDGGGSISGAIDGGADQNGSSSDGKQLIDAPSSSSASSSSSGATGSEQVAHRVLEQVEKDLRRTEVGSDGDKLNAMRRVLCAFATYNPDVGYVQGMNFIAVALLRVFEEESTFWMLAMIVDEW